jgi:hypothetical protein
MKKLLPIALVATPLFAGFTFATISNAAVQGMAEGDMLGKTEAEITAALETLGAKIIEVESEDDEIEVELTLDGVAYEVEVDLTTGLIAEVELEDDEDEDDDDDDEQDDG